MAEGSIAGSFDVVQGVVVSLKANLQDYIDEIVADTGVTFSFEAPSEITGYGYCPTFTPRDRYNSIVVWVDSTTHVKANMCQLGPRREAGKIGILWLLHSPNLDYLEQKKQLGTQAIKRLLWKRWRVDLSAMGITMLQFDPTDYRFSSMRQRGGSTKGLKGHNVDSGDNIDGVIVQMNYEQRIDAPVQFV